MSEAPKIIFSDFDGTLTLGHNLRPCTFEIFDLCDSKKIPFVIVTGRSKSWAHFLLSHFPTLQYVISEGGGVLSGRENGKLFDELYVEEIEVRRLEALTEKLHKEFPGIELSVDSFGRQADRAIELSWLNDNPQAARDVVAFLKKEKINYSTSNVHLNYWCGKISKANSIKRFLQERTTHHSKDCLFFGDSLNEESVFKEIPSVGVSNISEVESQLVFKPETILLGPENEGPHGVLNYLKEILA